MNPLESQHPRLKLMHLFCSFGRIVFLKKKKKNHVICDFFAKFLFFQKPEFSIKINLPYKQRFKIRKFFLFI